MSIALDNTGQSGTALNVSTGIKITSFIMGSVSNGAIILFVSQYKTADTAPSATFNGSSFVLHDAATVVESPGTRRITLLKLVAPSAGTFDIIVSYSGATIDECVMGAVSFSGVDQTTPLGTASKNTGTSGTSTTALSITSAVGAFQVCGVAVDSSGSAAATANGGTKRWDAIAGSFTTEGAGQTAPGTGSAINMSFSTLQNGFWAQIGAPLNAAGGGGGPVINDANFRTISRGIGFGLGRGLRYTKDLNKYYREQERKHRDFMDKVKRAA